MPDRSSSTYDVAILGGGPGGCAAAIQASRRGARVCLVEAERLGGVCLNVGCVPTKAMLAASALYWRIRGAGAFGISVSRLELDAGAIMRHARELAEQHRAKLSQELASRKGLDVLYGRGRLTRPGCVVVEAPDGPRTITAASVVVATGARPIMPGLLPRGSPRILTCGEAILAPGLPESVIVVGGGPQGCELATLYSELGIRTHLVEVADRLLPGFEQEASQVVAESLAERGAEVITGRKVVGARSADDAVTVELDSGRQIAAAWLLVAVGRRANTDGIGLEEAGVRVCDGVIAVDERCRTSVEGVYAVGDVADKRQYAHLAGRMGVVAAENATGHSLRDDRSVVPVAVFTDPQVAAVGLAEGEARSRYGRVQVLRHLLRDNPAATVSGQTRGQVKLVAEGQTGRILGGLWIGPHAADLIHELALTVRLGLTAEDLYHTIHAHPTFQEALHSAAASWVLRASRRSD